MTPKIINGGGDEWYTPRQYVDAALSVMGGIDLDPASHPVASCWIDSHRYFTKEDDGLQHPWVGRIWLNPPYSQPAISMFVDKLISEFQNGNATEAICLTHSNSDTKWFHALANSATCLCLTRGRIRFLFHGTDKKKAPTHGQCFFYYGPNKKRFTETFSAFGVCLSLAA